MQLEYEQVLNRLRAKINYRCRIKDLAAHFSVSPAFMSAVLAGKKPITEPMLKAVGVKKIVIYENQT